MASYKIAAPDEYLAITGMGIKSVKITKATWVYPFQRCMRFSVQPHDYAMNLQAMTKEKLQFLLPVVFTVGPDVNQRGANRKGGAVSAAAAIDHAAGGDDLSGHPDDHPHDNEHMHNSQREDRGDALVKYAMLLADSGAKREGNNHQFLENIVKGIIEGETRVLVSRMTMEEIFTERDLFKRRIFKNIQGELSQFGLRIYNSNVKELKDAPNSVYFESLSRKAHEGATNQARIDVAEAQLRGTVGESKRKGEQEREIAKIAAETAVQKTERDIERASAEATLATRKAALNRDVEIARIEATRLAESRDEDLKRDVEIKRAAAEMERLRAIDLSKAVITRETRQQSADARAYEVQAQARADYEKSKQTADAEAYHIQAQAKADFEKGKQAADAGAYSMKVDTDASQYRIKIDAEANQFRMEREADAANYAAVKRADAELQRQLREAEGLSARADAYAKLAQAFGGPAGLLQYLMIERGTYGELARHNADAVRGMQPKISVWNTGAQAGTSEGAGAAGGVGNGTGQTNIDTMRNIYQMLPPLMTTINEQTGITLPEWQFGRMAGQMSQIDGGERKRGSNVNGK